MRWLILIAANHLNCCTISSSRHPSWSCFFTPTLLANTPVTRGLNATLLSAARCSVLPAWNPSLVRWPLYLHQRSWLLRYRFCFCHHEAIDLLQINCHILSSANHNPMIIGRIKWYLNKGRKIMCNKHDSVRVALEAILLLLYAWNSSPVPGTDISCSLVAFCHEFAFPIGFSSGKHWELTSSPSTIIVYSKEIATRLAACHFVAELLVCKHRSYHRELINAPSPNPRLYSIGDIAFARRAIRSDSSRSQVNKL